MTTNRGTDQGMDRRTFIQAAGAIAAGGALAVPIRRGNAVVGVLALARPRGAPLMDGVAAAAVHALAAHAGTAVANGRGHHDAQRLSVTDPLTGAGNVRHLTATLNREVERAHRRAWAY